MSTPREQIPLSNPGLSAHNQRQLIDTAFARVLDSGQFILGPENLALENELGLFFGTGIPAVTVANGTDSLQLALAALGVGAGDGVVTVANAGGYSSTAILALNAVPLYVDVLPSSLLIDIGSLDFLDRDFASHNVKAIIVTHLYGHAVEMSPVLEWARVRGIAVIEDVAQAIGARTEGRPVGSFGDAAALSFYPTKNLGALGDGGAVITANAEISERVRSLRQYGWGEKYRISTPGGRNSRMDELQAAVVRNRLPELGHQTKLRQQIYRRYLAVCPEKFVTREVGDEYVAHLAVLRVQDRDRAQSLFTSLGISTDVHYPIPDHLQMGAEQRWNLPVTELASKQILTIPLFAEMSIEQIDRVCQALVHLDELEG